MNVTLTKDLEEFVETRVRDGGYADAGEVIRDALRHLRQVEEGDLAASPELEAMLLEGLDSPKMPYDRSVMDRVAEKVIAQRGSGK